MAIPGTPRRPATATTGSTTSRATGKKKGRSGFGVWRFRLVAAPPRDPATDPPPTQAPRLPAAPTSSTRQSYATVQRLVRNTAVTQWVKELYDFTCHICGTRLETPAGGYAEGAHIRPVGRPHNGPDATEKVLCLCPNDHVLVDRGFLSIADDGRVLEAATGRPVGRLAVKGGHQVDPAHLAYRRTLFGP